jgi:hypothetical protein
LTVCVLEGKGGRFPEGGGGGGGLLPVVEADWACKLFPTPCWFKAAMRAESDVNCGSSVSVIVCYFAVSNYASASPLGFLNEGNLNRMFWLIVSWKQIAGQQTITDNESVRRAMNGEDND